MALYEGFKKSLSLLSQLWTCSGSFELAETSSCTCSGVPQSSTRSGTLIYNCAQNQLYTKVSAALSPNHQIHVLPLISCPAAKQPLLRLLYLIPPPYPHPQRQCFWGVPAWLPRPLCLPHREDEAEAGSGNAERERRTQGGRAREKKKKKNLKGILMNPLAVALLIPTITDPNK